MGKPKRFNQYDSEVAKERGITENYGIARQSKSSIISGIQHPPQGRAISSTTNVLQKSGGKMTGPIGFSMNTITISSGVLNLSTNASTGAPVQSYALMATESGSTDTLDKITNRKYPGQLLILSNAIPGSTITITDEFGADGQIQCPGSIDLEVEYPESVILIDDDLAGGVYQTWRVIGVPKSSGSSSWVGSATSDLDMNGYDIKDFDDIIGGVGDKYFFDGGSDTYITGSATSGRINVFNNNVNVTSFLTSGLSTTNITCSGIDTTGDITMNQNDMSEIGSLKFDSTSAIGGSDVGWSSSTGDLYGNVQSNDSYFFRENGTTIVEMDNDGIDIRTGWLEMTDISAPSAPSANHLRLYCEDNGAGKSRLVVKFNGSSAVLATEL